MPCRLGNSLLEDTLLKAEALSGSSITLHSAWHAADAQQILSERTIHSCHFSGLVFSIGSEVWLFSPLAILLPSRKHITIGCSVLSFNCKELLELKNNSYSSKPHLLPLPGYQLNSLALHGTGLSRLRSFICAWCSLRLECPYPGFSSELPHILEDSAQTSPSLGRLF